MRLLKASLFHCQPPPVEGGGGEGAGHDPNRQGCIPADTAGGRDSKFKGCQGTSVLGLFGMTLAATGASEKTLKRIGRPYKKMCFCTKFISVRPRNKAM